MVWASSVRKLEALVKAEVRVYSRSNQLIAEGKTGRDGIFMLHRTAPWNDELRPFLYRRERRGYIFSAFG